MSRTIARLDQGGLDEATWLFQDAGVASLLMRIAPMPSARADNAAETGISIQFEGLLVNNQLADRGMYVVMTAN